MMFAPSPRSWALLTALFLSGFALPATAGFPIRIPAPGKKAYFEMLRASRAVNREVPMRLGPATTTPQVKTEVRNGIIHERATVIANVDYDTFVKRLDPATWSLHLPQRWGGEVRKIDDRRKDGRGVALQQERMVLGLPALDMTKNSMVIVGKNKARVRWQVTHSDRSLPALGMKTVLMDNGWIEFARTADNRVQITTRSAHHVSTLPSLPLEKLAPRLAERLMARSLASFFEKTVANYKKIGETALPLAD